ncbi:MAG: hypothetical protein LUQ04_00810 [Methanoregula sp.]|nr:hypothetical protein [Methanoregula sp.]
MRGKGYPVRAVLLVIVLITIGVMTPMIFQDSGKTIYKTVSAGKESYSSGDSSPASPNPEDIRLLAPPSTPGSNDTKIPSDSYITVEQPASDIKGPKFDQGYVERSDFNEVVIYNGIISTMSVSPTLVLYDYNHDGIVDYEKTVLCVNII